MRTTAILLGTALALTSCSKPAEQSSAKLSQDRGAAANTEKMIDAPNAEPIAVAAAVFSIASSMKNLFDGGGADGNAGVKRRLDQIAAQNAAILQTLGQIVTVLNNLGVTIRDNVRLETIFEKQARLMSEQRQMFETWGAELQDRRAAGQATTRYQNDILPDVRDVTRELMQDGYGYTAFDTVGHGMMMEFWLSKRLGLRKAVRQNDAASYVTYYNKALNNQLQNTPARALADAIAQRDRLKPILDAADARVGSGGWTVEMGRGWRQTGQNGRNTYYALESLRHSVTGNQKDGYTFRAETVVVDTRTDHEGGCIPCKGALTEPDPQDPGVDTPASRVNYWNAVRSTHQKASKEAEALSQIVKTLQFYRDQAEAVRTAG